MTWNNTPVPVAPASDGATPMPATARPGYLTIGDLFNGAFETYKRGWALFLKLILMPYAILFGSVIAFGLVVAGLMISTGAGSRTSSATTAIAAIWIASWLYALFIVGVQVLMYVYLGRLQVASIDMSEGRGRPTWGNLASRTKGLARRLIVMVLVLVALVVVGFGVVFGIGFALVASVGDGDRLGGIAAFVMMMLFLALIVGMIFVSIRLVYAPVAIAYEGLGGIDGLKRSWAITKGRFWPTIGRYLVGMLVMYAVTMVLQLVLAPLMAGIGAMGGRNRDLNPAQIGLMVLIFLIYIVISLLLAPFTAIWTALMYLSELRLARGEGVAQVYATPDGPAMPWQQSVPGGATAPGVQPGPGATPYGGGAASYGAAAQYDAPTGTPYAAYPAESQPERNPFARPAADDGAEAGNQPNPGDLYGRGQTGPNDRA